MAGSRGDIEAGKAFVRLYLKNDITKSIGGVLANVKVQIEGAAKAIKGIAETSERLSGAFAKLGTAIVGPLAALASRNEEIRKKVDAIWQKLSGPIAKALMPLVDAAAKMADQVAEWLEKNQALVRSVFELGLGFLAVSAAFKIIGGTATILATALQGLALVATPMGAVVAVIGILAAGIAKATGLTTDLKRSLGSLGEALRAGNLEVAWEIIVESMKLTWVKFSNFIADTFRTAVERALVAPLEKFGALSPEFAKAFRDTLKGLNAESQAEQQRIQDKLTALKLRAGGKGEQGSASDPGKFKFGVLSAFPAAGAALLQHSVDRERSIGARTYAELREIRKTNAEAVRLLKEMNARRDRPGIFK